MPVNSSHVGVLIVAALLGLGAQLALADNLPIHLSGAEETPPVSTSASAVGTIRVYADRTISGSIKTSGIAGTMAHVHLAPLGQSGPPIITLTKTSDGVWSVLAGRKLTEDQYRAYKAGDLYVNVHSTEHASGEIRAQLKPESP